MKNKYLKYTDTRECVPFETAEEAWFWCCLCEQLGHERARGGAAKTARPCESSDIVIALKRLGREGRLKPEHIRVLRHYGLEQAPPHPNFGASHHICRLWQEGIRFLDTLLKQKGIVAACFI